jgi:hypothetical protein
MFVHIDKNRIKTNDNGSVDLSDPLHIVVFDMTKYGPELTDDHNRTGNIAEFGRNTKTRNKPLAPAIMLL